MSDASAARRADSPHRRRRRCWRRCQPAPGCDLPGALRLPGVHHALPGHRPAGLRPPGHRLPAALRSIYYRNVYNELVHRCKMAPSFDVRAGSGVPPERNDLVIDDVLKIAHGCKKERRERGSEARRRNAVPTPPDPRAGHAGGDMQSVPCARTWRRMGWMYLPRSLPLCNPSIAVWAGESGKRYDFAVIRTGSMGIDEPAVYIFVKRQAEVWIPL